MFSFHKPKVYRSTQGCCICKAKSSSSRFTDSKKYEDDFIECFQLASPRCGEICNACVLLVKRFKRLPPGSERHWSHVVDARIGPGIKSMNKFKKRKEEQQNGTIVGYAREFAGQSETNAQNMNNGIRLPERFGHFLKKTKKKLIKETATADPESDENSEPNTQSEIEMRLHDDDLKSIIGIMLPEHLKRQPIGSVLLGKMRRRKSYHPLKNRNKYINHSVSAIDQNVWTKVKSCCGYVYENSAIGALLIDHTTLTQHGCAIHKREEHITMNAMNAPIAYDVAAQPRKKSLKSLPLKKQHTLGKRYTEQTELIETDAQTNNVAPMTNNKLPLKSMAANVNAQKRQTEISTSSKCAVKSGADKSQLKLNAIGGNQLDMNAKKSNKLIDVLSVTKFSDNSSDSGYDETLHDTAQLNQIAKIGASRPVILSNGVKIHVQPQNLLLAANLAGVSQTAIQTTQANMRATLLVQQKLQLDQSNQAIRGTNAITNA